MKLDGNLPVEFIPTSELRIGKRYVRWEVCEKCRQETSMEFTCVSVKPRRWEYRCLTCSQKLQDGA